VNRARLLGIVVLVFLTSFALIEVFPYLWMAMGSLKSLKEINRFPPTIFPSSFLWGNYVKAWQSGPFPRYFLNSFVVTFSILGIQLFLACMAAYAFSKIRFPGRDFLFYVVIMCLIVPPQVRFVPLFIMFSKVNLINTYFPLVLPYATSALGTFLIRQAFMDISDDTIAAAKIDGASTLRIIFRIMAPMAKPTIVAFSLFSIVYHWNEYFWPLVMTTDETVRTLPLGVAMLREQGTGARWHIIMAGNMFVVVPMLVVFAFVQRTIIRSFTMTTMK